jgi:hypothetical protein
MITFFNVLILDFFGLYDLKREKSDVARQLGSKITAIIKPPDGGLIENRLMEN